MGNRYDGELICVAGSSRSGKTAWVKQQIEPLPRVIVWDIEAQYRKGYARARTPAELVGLVRGFDAGPGRIAYSGPMASFEFWARACFAWTRIAPCCVVAEETSDVTHSGKAPAGWGELVRRGLKYGTWIYSITQRPAESDKTTVGNATVIHSHRLSRAADRQAMAKELDVDPAELARLAPLEYLQKRSTGELSRGVVRFGKQTGKQTLQPIQTSEVPNYDQILPANDESADDTRAA